jgi:hypothetical protein
LITRSLSVIALTIYLSAHPPNNTPHHFTVMACLSYVPPILPIEARQAHEVREFQKLNISPYVMMTLNEMIKQRFDGTKATMDTDEIKEGMEYIHKENRKMSEILNEVLVKKLQPECFEFPATVREAIIKAYKSKGWDVFCGSIDDNKPNDFAVFEFSYGANR